MSNVLLQAKTLAFPPGLVIPGTTRGGSDSLGPLAQRGAGGSRGHEKCAISDIEIQTPAFVAHRNDENRPLRFLLNRASWTQVMKALLLRLPPVKPFLEITDGQCL